MILVEPVEELQNVEVSSPGGGARVEQHVHLETYRVQRAQGPEMPQVDGRQGNKIL
jgi:hypothetical protein